MTCLSEPHPQDRLEHALRCASPSDSEMSIVELVLFACDASEDAGEIDDLVCSAIDSGSARLLPLERDPFLIRTSA